jgi:hypothetical protein
MGTQDQIVGQYIPSSENILVMIPPSIVGFLRWVRMGPKYMLCLRALQPSTLYNRQPDGNRFLQEFSFLRFLVPVQFSFCRPDPAGSTRDLVLATTSALCRKTAPTLTQAMTAPKNRQRVPIWATLDRSCPDPASTENRVAYSGPDSEIIKSVERGNLATS